MAGALSVTALVTAQSPKESAESAVQPAPGPSSALQVAPPPAATPPLPEPALPPLGAAEPAPASTVLLEAQAGWAQKEYFIDGFHHKFEGRNGGGDLWKTDGRLGVVELAPPADR